jgi:hypothetical protein
MITNPQKVAEMLNAYFVETVEEIIKQNNYPSNSHIAHSKIRVLSQLNIRVTYY